MSATDTLLRDTVVREDNRVELESGFRAFTEAARSLESVYARLESSSRGVDSSLKDANRSLVAQVAGLDRENAELGAIFNGIPCGVVACAADLSVQRLNRAAERMLGRDAVELVGRDVRSFRGRDGAAILLLGREPLVAHSEQERTVSCLDGSQRTLVGTVEELPTGGWLEILTDRTEVRHLRSQVTRLDTLAAMGEMAAGIAHEIRNPLSAVQGFAALMQRQLTDGTPTRELLHRYCDRIRRGTAEVDGIIANLLLWARPGSGHPERLELNAVLDEVQHDAREALRSSGSGVVLAFAQAPRGVCVHADRLRLKLALNNLVRNAMEATGNSGRVEVAVRCMDGRVLLQVDDNGPGVAPSMRARLFRPFSTSKAGGTGLGLALARRFVEVDGGEINVSTAPLGGARFEIMLPALAVAGAA
ncbi:MAG: hypothetical protein EXS14_09375 [Planctomycetes bacterium]|nr:hypothetical protein [Planctomycetota bacterium]